MHFLLIIGDYVIRVTLHMKKPFQNIINLNFCRSGYMILSTWAWSVMCAFDMFLWNLCFLFVNSIQIVYIMYQMRPIRFDPELEEAYHTLFRPFKVVFTKYFYNCSLFYSDPCI